MADTISSEKASLYNPTPSTQSIPGQSMTPGRKNVICNVQTDVERSALTPAPPPPREQSDLTNSSTAEYTTELVLDNAARRLRPSSLRKAARRWAPASAT